MSISDIYQAFGAVITTLPNKPSIIVWQNSTPSSDLSTQTSYMSEHMLNTDGTSPTIDGTGHEIDDGIYQVSIAIQKGVNKYTALNLAQGVKDLFPRSTRLTQNDTTINIRRVVINDGGYNNETHWIVPVSIYWRVVS